MDVVWSRWRSCGWQRLTNPVAWTHDHAFTLIWRARREGGATVCADTLQGNHGRKGELLERRVFHRISDSDFTTRRHISCAQEIRRRIMTRLDAWDVGKHQMLMEETKRTWKQYLSASWQEELEEQRAMTSQLLSCVGKMWIAVRWIMEQEKGGITASWPLFKDGVSCARCDSIGASQRASSIIHYNGMLSGSSSGDGLAGLDVGHHIWGGTENFQRGRTGRDGLGDTTELDLVIWGGQRTPMGDCWFLHGVARKSPSILGRVYGHNGREVNWNQ